MSNFKWDISEPATSTDSIDNGGIVQLDDMKAVAPTPGWRVKTPDGTAVAPQPSGEVELAKPPPSRSPISNGVLNFAVIMLVLLVATMILKDVKAGTLTLERFLWLIVPPLTGHLAGRK